MSCNDINSLNFEKIDENKYQLNCNRYQLEYIKYAIEKVELQKENSRKCMQKKREKAILKKLEDELGENHTKNEESTLPSKSGRKAKIGNEKITYRKNMYTQYKPQNNTIFNVNVISNSSNSDESDSYVIDPYKDSD